MIVKKTLFNFIGAGNNALLLALTQRMPSGALQSRYEPKDARKKNGQLRRAVMQRPDKRGRSPYCWSQELCSTNRFDENSYSIN